MPKCILLVLFCTLAVFHSKAQPVDPAGIYADYTLYAKRMSSRQNLYKYEILRLLKQPLDTLNEYSFKSSMWTISQYMLKNDTTKQLIDTLFSHYQTLEPGTRRSLMEVVYGLYPTEYTTIIKQIWPSENDDRLLAVLTLYLKRNQQIDDTEVLKRLMQNPEHYDSSAVLQQLDRILFQPATNKKLPDLAELFAHQQSLGCKMIYSLQRPDRNYPGLAIIQNADGSFVKDPATGELKTFVQLARSASDLPYFITNGSTPQGAYRIHGTAVSYNRVIGPTPNIQLNLPYEVPGDTFFIHPPQAIVNDTLFLNTYQQLFPANWQTAGMMESYQAGKCGRGAIIAHGTTIDPWYYQQQAFYPCTPTLGCLCAQETWNPYTGRIQRSDQLSMVNAFLSTPGTDGYLYVINLDDKKTAVTPEEAGLLVKAFETKRPENTAKH